MDTKAIKLLHEWTVNVKTKVDETTTEMRNGQPVKITAPVEKDVPHKMALKQLTRRESRQAELFYGRRYSMYFSQGFLSNSIVADKHLQQTGNSVSARVSERIDTLRRRENEINNDLVRATGSAKEVKEKLENELTTLRVELSDLYSSNTAFNHTADKRAERDLNDWLTYRLILVEVGGQWQPFFKGETFDEQEESMWRLEEDEDPLYGAAVEKIALYIGLFNIGLTTTEQFKKAEEELAKQHEARLAMQKAAKEAAEKAEADQKVVDDAQVTKDTLAATEPTSDGPSSPSIP